MCKADEITSGGSHKLPESSHQYPEIYQWIDNKLRVELQLRSKKLKALNLEYASQLTPHGSFGSSTVTSLGNWICQSK
ncbi:phage/plasmid replication protein [Pseudomonas aeruginosa]|uniref:phage/plasmid replication domain-containing protein n=1 Tax=Pseudomonas aeruginosa TaxID=287 RepID=UPI00391EF614